MRGAQSKMGRRCLTILAKTAACFEQFRPMEGPGLPEEVSEDPSSEEEAPVPDASSEVHSQSLTSGPWTSSPPSHMRTNTDLDFLCLFLSLFAISFESMS